MNKYEYDKIFAQTLPVIRVLQMPHSNDPIDNTNFQAVKEKELFDFKTNLNTENSVKFNEARNIFIQCFRQILGYLFKKYELNFEEIEKKSIPEFGSTIYFSLFDASKNTIYFFKDIEKSPLWLKKIPDNIEELAKKVGAKQVKFVYFLRGNASDQLLINKKIGSVDKNVFLNISDFFEIYFPNEFEPFMESLDEHLKQANNAIGIIQINTLSTQSLINFKNNTVTNFCNKDFTYLSSIEFNQCSISSNDIITLTELFKKSDIFSLFFENEDFIESFVTAEWLYHSLKQACAIDLTTIAISYFKTIEQLLSKVILSHKNKGYKIKKNSSYKELPRFIDLNDKNIREGYIDLSLGSMSNFFKKNHDIIDDSISYHGKKYIVENLFDYTSLRNGYTHKDNIHNWETIYKIRNATYISMFLILASTLPKHEASNDNENSKIINDYYKLCAYFTYHSGQLFLFEIPSPSIKEPLLVVSIPDYNTEIINNRYIQYSGIYFKVLGTNFTQCVNDKNRLPKAIYRAKFEMNPETGEIFKPNKEDKVFENGKFLANLDIYNLNQIKSE